MKVTQIDLCVHPLFDVVYTGGSVSRPGSYSRTARQNAKRMAGAISRMVLEIAKNPKAVMVLLSPSASRSPTADKIYLEQFARLRDFARQRLGERLIVIPRERQEFSGEIVEELAQRKLDVTGKTKVFYYGEYRGVCRDEYARHAREVLHLPEGNFIPIDSLSIENPEQYWEKWKRPKKPKAKVGKRPKPRVPRRA